VGDFPGFRWAEWNGRYRDVIRAFVRGDPGLVPEVATRIAGSSDLYEPRGRLPMNTVNFVTCHDGFSLWDLVSYNQKHNEANGEDNRDGHNHNLSWNCGVEGATDDPGILALRRRQARNFIAILMLSQGAVMLLSGDEMLRSKQGNNNSYCQNNTISWLDWGRLDENRTMHEHVRGLIRLRLRHPTLTRNRFLTGRRDAGHDLPDIAWHGVGLDNPDWDDPLNRRLAFTLAGATGEEPPLHVMLNMDPADAEFAVPHLDGRLWRIAVDTAQEPSVREPGDQAAVQPGRIKVGGRSVVVLEGHAA
jgi:glycogen operon protein